MEENKPKEIRVEPYFSEEELRVSKIAFVSCEAEENCGFYVEFKYPNCTFFYCKKCRKGVNADLERAVRAPTCIKHGDMERYNLLSEDNVCPSCENSTLAILSLGRE